MADSHPWVIASGAKLYGPYPTRDAAKLAGFEMFGICRVTFGVWQVRPDALAFGFASVSAPTKAQITEVRSRYASRPKTAISA
ncbi:MAG: hypothetical protein ACYC96_09580 [Fimbriimonadaceae bacterium]